MKDTRVLRGSIEVAVYLAEGDLTGRATCAECLWEDDTFFGISVAYDALRKHLLEVHAA